MTHAFPGVGTRSESPKVADMCYGELSSQALFLPDEMNTGLDWQIACADDFSFDVSFGFSELCLCLQLRCAEFVALVVPRHSAAADCQRGVRLRGARRRSWQAASPAEEEGLRDVPDERGRHAEDRRKLTSTLPLLVIYRSSLTDGLWLQTGFFGGTWLSPQRGSAPVAW
jgi:hypothetical protein